MGSTQAKWRGNQLAFFDATTHETVEAMAPRKLFQDFEGATYDTLNWLYVANGVNTPPALDTIGNVLAALDADGNTQDSGIVSAANVLAWDISKGLVIEFRAKLSVLPTSDTEIHFGVYGQAQANDAQICSADDVAEHAVFSFDGSGVCTINTDDGSNETTASATGVTVLNSAYHVYRIDFTDDENVLFFIDGEDVTPAAGVDMSDIASPLVQPVALLLKHGADAGLGTVLLDYVKIWASSR